MLLTGEQFRALVTLVETCAELEARKVHCELTDGSYEQEQFNFLDAEEKAQELLMMPPAQEHPMTPGPAGRDSGTVIVRTAVLELGEKYQETLQRLGSLLGMPAGTDLTAHVIPAVKKLMEQRGYLQENVDRGIDNEEKLQSKLIEAEAELAKVKRQNDNFRTAVERYTQTIENQSETIKKLQARCDALLGTLAGEDK